MNNQTVLDQLQALRLHGMREGFEQQLQQPTYHALGFEQRLGLLVDAEISHRDSHRLKRLLKAAKLKVQAHPEDIEYRLDRGLDRAVMAELLTMEWVRRRQNLVLTGKTGTGKTWLACALGTQAARQGTTVLYKRVSRLLEELAIAHNDGSLLRLRGQLAKVQLLILDDFGLVPMTAQGKSDLLELLDDRIGATATIVLGQMPIKDWHAYISDPALADAILDRLIHSSHKIALKGDSMRRTSAARAGGAA